MSLQAELHRAHVERLRKFFPPKPAPRPVTIPLSKPQEEPHQTTQQHHSDVKIAPVPPSEPLQMPHQAQVGAPLWGYGPIQAWAGQRYKSVDRLFISAQILDLTLQYYSVSKPELLSVRKAMPAVEARQVCMYLLKIHTKQSYPWIGRFMGGRDHTTVLHAIRKVMRHLAEPNSRIAMAVRALEARIG